MSRGISRRKFLAGAGAGAALVAAGPMASSARAAAPGRTAGRARRGRETVAVFGGGIAGLTAAHELALRGFDVTVYERRAWGGKARSVEVPNSAAGGRRKLPGEHGYRIEFGFYRNLPDTMEKIPFGSNRRGVADNLVAPSLIMLARAGKRNILVPLENADAEPATPTQIRDMVVALAFQLDFPPPAAAYLADRLVVFFSSCDPRRYGQWDNVSWSDFMRAEQYGGDYQRLFSEMFTHVLQASLADRTSTENVGFVLESAIYGLLKRNTNGPIVRLLDAPTNEAWIDPWLAELQRLGVRLVLGRTVEGFTMAGGRIAGASVRGPQGVEEVVADWFVPAATVERARRLWSSDVHAAAPELRRMDNLETAWMNGIQIYLREETPIAKGHIVCLDSPWKVSSISQAQYWKRDFASTYGDGRAHESVSIVISDWNTPGIVFGKPARELTPAQVVREAWEQMKRHLNDDGRRILSDDMVVGWNVDPGLLVQAGGGFENEDPLVIPTVGSHANRPASGTSIPNLVLAGDYVQGDWWVATMEQACAGGRSAAAAIVERSGGRDAVEVFVHYRPPEWEPLKKIDAARYRAGQPNLFDTVDAPSLASVSA